MSGGILIIIIVAIVIAAAVLAGIRQRRSAAEALKKRLASDFGKAPSKRMSPERYAEVPACFLHHPPQDPVDDITWNDLDLDAVYHCMDSTQSSIGEEYLYALLRSPEIDPADPDRRYKGSGRNVINDDSAEAGMHADGGSGDPADSGCVTGIPHEEIEWFEQSSHEETRIRMQTALVRLGHIGRHSMYEYIDPLKEAEPDSNWKHVPAFLLPAVSIVILCLNVPAGILCLIISMIINMALYYHFKAKADPYISGLVYLLRLMKCADEILDAHRSAPAEGIVSVSSKEKDGTASGTGRPEFEYPRLAKLQKEFAGIRRGSGILVSGSSASGGSPVDFILDYIRILFHIDLIRFNSMLTRVKQQLPEIDEELLLVGRIDAAISLASFEVSLPYTCQPELINDKGRLVFKEVYHPLLKEPVANTLRTDQPVLLTGSNASGKSTFLKSVALCALFAQTIGFCPAREYRGTWFRIRSSMALRDNILNGESYFMVEIRSLKRIADLSCDGGRPVLCCIDEVLRGTNTIERIAASSVILKTLAGRGVLVFAATHDIELTSLLNGTYRNMHFEEELGEKDVTFSYQLKDGPAVSRNAIRLLSRVGFDPQVTEQAQRMAAEFEQTGKWEINKIQ